MLITRTHNPAQFELPQGAWFVQVERMEGDYNGPSYDYAIDCDGSPDLDALEAVVKADGDLFRAEVFEIVTSPSDTDADDYGDVRKRAVIDARGWRWV